MPSLEQGTLEARTGGMIYFDRPGYYFGYGTESIPKVVEALVERQLNYEVGVFAVNKLLAVQEVDQIPEVPIAQLGGKSAQDIVASAWRAHTDHPVSTYVLRNSDNRSDMVRGTLYEIEMDDALALVDWSLATPSFGDGAWRFWNHSLELADGRPAMTLTVSSTQDVDRVIDGADYEPFLMDEAPTFAVIDDFTTSRER